MHSVYTFNFLETISIQLKESLESLSATPLDGQSLAHLAQFQMEKDRFLGVYLLEYNGSPVYVGKANDVADRLGQHLQKLLGRQGVSAPLIAYKALLLDESMGTAASEDVLIKMFKRSYPLMWNGRGFGPKDPGQHRDTTQPSWFDMQFPIVSNFPVLGLADSERLGTILDLMKQQLPYVFRFNVPEPERSMQIDLRNVPRDAADLLRHLVNCLGAGWQGVVISYGMVLYRGSKEYPHGRVFTSSSA